MALVMLGSALAFSAVFTGPWGGLKSAAFATGTHAWLAYVLGFLALNLLVMPGLFTLAVWVRETWSGSKLQLRQAIAEQAQVLLPLGLFAWIAFTISFAFPKFNYVVAVIADPLGWGWNLLGNANATWLGDASGFSSLLQIAILVIGLSWSANVARRLAGPDFRKALTILIFTLLYSFAMLWLLVG
jgi:hypothetical protein